jgi:protein-S-isoprenylcysteine O-methyltransferase Ste14
MEPENINSHKNKVHHILIHSYFIYLVLFLIGVCLDMFFKVDIYTGSLSVSIGIIILILASLLILWAQFTTRNFNKDKENEISKETFCHGPYCYTRSPTHWGLFFLILSFGIIVNAFFIVLTAFISLAITKFIFIPKQEKILEEKYGVHYTEYKKQVKI